MNEKTSVKTVYLGLGCNLGNRFNSLKKVVSMLEKLGEVVSSSKIYESPAWGYDDKRAYLNMCCALLTSLSPESLHKETLKIETALGRETNKRKEGEPYRPRLMDIDLLFFGDEVVKTKALSIPHPQLHLRNFVLRPLMDIAPNFVHPTLGLTVEEMLNNSEDRSELQELS